MITRFPMYHERIAIPYKPEATFRQVIPRALP